MIYLDSSAILKLLHLESESAALGDWIAARAEDSFVSSELAVVEVMRACRRVNAETLPSARVLLAGIDLVPLTRDVLDDAAEVGNPAVRSLDAVHLATALSLREDLSAFVAYDRRLVEAAAAAGLEPLRPGT